MTTLPPSTSIQKVNFLLPLLLFALHVYWPESSSLAWRMLRVLLLPRCIPFLVQSISGVGKLRREQSNRSDELYLTDWFLSSGLISGGPGHGTNKHKWKKVKEITRKNEKGKSNKNCGFFGPYFLKIWRRDHSLNFICDYSFRRIIFLWRRTVQLDL